MIVPEIEIALDDNRRWFTQWKCANGTTLREVFGSRKALADAMPAILSAVRGTPFPTIDEEITIEVPRRRANDI